GGTGRGRGWAPGAAAVEMGIAEEAGRRETVQCLGHLCVGIRVVAEGGESLPAEEAGPACDDEGDDHAIAAAERAHPGAKLHHFSHELVAEHVARLHGRDEAVVEMEIRAADGGGGDLDDGIARIHDLGHGDVVHANVARAVPADGLHDWLPMSLVATSCASMRCLNRRSPSLT